MITIIVSVVPGRDVGPSHVGDLESRSPLKHHGDGLRYVRAALCITDVYSPFLNYTRIPKPQNSLGPPFG